jgi:hypothetical protein
MIKVEQTRELGRTYVLLLLARRRRSSGRFVVGRFCSLCTGVAVLIVICQPTHSHYSSQRHALLLSLRDLLCHSVLSQKVMIVRWKMVGELSGSGSQECGSRIFADKLETHSFRAARQALNCNKSEISIDWCCSIALLTCIHICTQKTIEVRCPFPPSISAT